MQDSGAARSFINVNLADKLKEGVVKPSLRSIRLANGTIIPSRGSVSLVITFIGVKRRYTFEIINHPTYQVILGLELLNEF